MDEVSETPSSASVSSEVPLGIGNDSSQRTDFIASLRKPGHRTVRKRKAQEDSEGEGEGGGSESERYRVLAREAVWCAFLFGACEKKLVGAAIRRAWGVSSLAMDSIESAYCLLIWSLQASANADEAPYQEARGNFQDHVKRHKYATLEAMEAWITSEMEVPGVRAKLTETSHRGRVLHFKAQFSIVNFFQVFGFLAGYLNFDKTAPLGKWYCKCKSFFLCQYADSGLHMMIGYGINGSKLINLIYRPLRQPCNRDCCICSGQ